jgi:cytochrome b6-f complex iron-sulfur subunit
MSAKEQPERGVQTPVAKPAPRPGPPLPRRVVILGGFWSSMLLAAVGIMGAPLDFVWPRRRPGGFGGTFFVSADQVPEPGAEPVRFPTGRFYLKHMAEGEEGSPGGLLAIYQKCTHLGCTVPWRADFRFEDKTGWYRCPCHGSTYTKGAAILVFGPAPRPLDLFAVEVQETGDLVVNTGAITKGSVDNPQRVVPYSPAAVAKRGAPRRKV